jgi:copper/silver efflux system protein
MIFNENGALVGYVYIDLEGRDPGSYVNDAKAAVALDLKLPPGTYLNWTGQYEHLQRMQSRMKMVLPLTLFIIFVFLYLTVKSTSKSLIIMCAIPFSIVGGILFVWSLGYNMSVAIWVGIIALLGIAIQDTMVMVNFLDEAWDQDQAAGKLNNWEDYLAATSAGARKSFRPIMMDIVTDFFGLIPVMWAVGLGADVMKRLSAPTFGGLAALLFLILLVIPVIYLAVRSREVKRQTQLLR